jgi:xylan 1,4-beta-xylosidase
MRAKNFFMTVLLFAVGGSALYAQETPEARARRVAQARLERIPSADLGNGYYRNPFVVGTGSDNTVLRVDKDFYMMAGGGAMPGELIWHSRDLVNWRPITRALRKFDGGTWASDLAYHKGKYYLYTTQVDARREDRGPLTINQRSLLGVLFKAKGDRAFKNVVLWADSPAGPWSDPIDIGVYGFIDPGHVVDPQGNRYLYFSKGVVIRLAPDGLSTVGELQAGYNGWEYPKDWAVECMCLEAPKLAYRSGYYYISAAQGGTGGPSTAHMGVMARSKSVEGPWENSPYNPMIRTQSRLESWWRQGHGTLIDDVAGNWWFQYTGYDKEALQYGKQVLMLPVEWTADGWPRIPPGVTASGVFRKPAGENVGDGMPLSDDFSGPTRGIQWTHSPSVNPDTAFKFGGGRLAVTAGGKGPTDGTSLNLAPANRAYEVEVEIEVPAGVEAGLILSGGRGGGGGSYAAAGMKQGQAFAKWQGVPNEMPWTGNRILVQIRNDHADVTCKYSKDGKVWVPFDNSTSVAGASRVGLYAAGQGEAIFRNFKYRGLD